MLQRDLAYCQEVANFVADEKSPFRYVHLRTDEKYQYIEACNNKLMIVRKEDKLGSGYDDCYKVVSKIHQYHTINQLCCGQNLVTDKGVLFAERIPDIKYPQIHNQIGAKGQYHATFCREELYSVVRDFCACRFEKFEPELTFKLDKMFWRILGVKGNHTAFKDELSRNFTDNIIDDNFSFKVKARHLRLITKWFEGEYIVLSFQNISGKVTKKIIITPTDDIDNGKIAVIVPLTNKE